MKPHLPHAFIAIQMPIFDSRRLLPQDHRHTQITSSVSKADVPNQENLEKRNHCLFRFLLSRPSKTA